MSAAAMTRTGPIHELQQELVAEFARDPRGRGVAKLLAAYAAAHDDWRAYALESDGGYTRNLVARTEAFELIVLCWRAGQESPIHCHAGQHCWMAVIDGEFEEVQYDAPADVRPGPLQPVSSRSYGRGKVAYIHDDIALHIVRPKAGGSGCSLHLYSRPIDTCRIYDPRSGAVQTKTMSYHSVHGVVGARWA